MACKIFQKKWHKLDSRIWSLNSIAVICTKIEAVEVSAIILGLVWILKAKVSAKSFKKLTKWVLTLRRRT